MVFGKDSSQPKDNETQPPENIVDLLENEKERPSSSAASCQRNAEKDATRPLSEQVTIVGSGTSKNVGGAKIWVCNHCKVQYTSLYTSIHTHFVGTQDKKKDEMQICPTMINDKEKLQ
ncbi:hypothetical protein L2E82_23214 [Cichorium intybus]|uniref:Uncharacterized protein n=1 Tax=Cichorium intybus TaxID=13427 RepID=A0ACB9E0T9_CICIN|nr:hypothetical protein L2E82_23214 [Cichorium intybus]